MKPRKIHIIALVLCLMFALCACGSSDSSKKKSKSEEVEFEEEEMTRVGETTAAETKAAKASDDDDLEDSVDDDDDLEIDAGLADTLSRSDYVSNCDFYSYKDLLRHNEDYVGRGVVVPLTIQKVADNQYLAVSPDGDNYIIFDERKSDNTRILVDDFVSVYGDYDGTVDVSGVELPKINARYIDIGTSGEDLSAEGEMYETMYVINCNESITLREEPSTKAKEIRQIPLGAPVSFIEPAENGFYKVIYLSDTGYALASYLGYAPQETVQAPPAPPAMKSYTYSPNTTLYVVNCKESITLRNTDSTAGAEICQIPLGAPVTYLEDANNGFFKIVYNGKTGYSLASYLAW